MNTFTKEIQLYANLYGYDLNSIIDRDKLIRVLGSIKNIAPNKIDKIKPTISLFSKGKAMGVVEPYYPNEGLIFVTAKDTKRLLFSQFFLCKN